MVEHVWLPGVRRLDAALHSSTFDFRFVDDSQSEVDSQFDGFRTSGCVRFLNGGLRRAGALQGSVIESELAASHQRPDGVAESVGVGLFVGGEELGKLLSLFIGRRAVEE